MKGIGLALFLSFMFLSSGAQSFRGRVLDKENNKPIDFASVSLLRADSLAIDFTMTEGNGSFSVAAEGKPVSFIQVSCLGYAMRMIPAGDFVQGSTLYMERSELAIKEVEVKFERIKQYGDTLNYAVGGFRQAQDRAIKDVLKRIPGIEVTSNGTILYQGKGLNRFYVEGMNLTDGKYNLITNNLSAKSVKNIQILENHQPITTLRGVSFSEAAALNLELEDDSKNKLLGTMDLGAGLEGQDKFLMDNRLLAMIFAPHKQNLTLYRNNNTGIDINEDIIMLTPSIIQSGGLMSESSNLFVPVSASGGDLEQNRYFFNDAHLVSTNHLSKFGKEETFRAQVSYYHNEETENGESSTTYILPGSDLVLLEKILAKSKTDEVEGKFTYNKNTEKTYLNNTTRILGRFVTSKGYISGDNEVKQETDLDRLSISNNFEAIFTVKKNSKFRLSSINIFNQLPQSITVSPGLYPWLLNDSIGYDRMVQDARLRSFYSHTYTSFSHPLFGMHVKYQAGLKVKTQKLRSSLSTSGEYYPANLADSLSNRFTYTESDVYLSPSLNYTGLQFRARAELNAAFRNIYRHDFLHDKAKLNDVKFVLEPTVVLEYNINAYYKLTAQFHYKQNYSDIYSLYPGYIFRSYRYASSNANEQSIRKAQNYSMGLFYKNPIKDFFYNLSGFYFTGKRNMLTQSEFTGILQQTSTIKHDVSDNTWGVSAYVSKSLPFWRFQPSLRYSFSNIEDTRILSGVYTKYRTETHSASFSFTMQPFRQLNIEAESKLNFSRLVKTQPEKEKYSPIRNSVTKMTVSYIPSKSLQFKSVNEYYHTASDGIPSKFFSDIWVSYLIKKSEFQLIVNNIFNNNEYKRESLGELTHSNSLYALRSRQIIFKYLFSF